MKKLKFLVLLLAFCCLPLVEASNISAPKFNSEWNINGSIYRVCRGLPQHARRNT
jgi:hypothetical protein